MKKNHNIFFVVGILTLIILFFVGCLDQSRGGQGLKYICEDSLRKADCVKRTWTLSFESGLILKMDAYLNMPTLRIGQQYEIYEWPARSVFAGEPVYRLFVKGNN